MSGRRDCARGYLPRRDFGVNFDQQIPGLVFLKTSGAAECAQSPPEGKIEILPNPE